jgi:hypothetical protein
MFIIVTYSTMLQSEKNNAGMSANKVASISRCTAGVIEHAALQTTHFAINKTVYLHDPERRCARVKFFWYGCRLCFFGLLRLLWRRSRRFHAT